MSESNQQEHQLAALMAEITPLLKRRVGPYVAWNPVSKTQIWQWCSAMGDNNPLYLDSDYHQQHGISTTIAPPTMMQMWTMRNVQGNHGPGSTRQNPYEILSIMENYGYNGVMAVSYDQTFHRYLQEGDHVHHYSTIVNISELKTTAVGKGFFVTEWAEYLDQHNECFAEATITYFQYRAPKRQPGTSSQTAPTRIQRVHPIENQDNAHYWQGLREGKLLLQRCHDCGTLRHPPQPMCEHCQSLRWDTLQASGKGHIYTFTVMHYPEIPPFEYPNIIVLVELEEGVRLASQLIDAKPDQVEIGLPVDMTIREVQPDLSLPLFRLSRSA